MKLYKYSVPIIIVLIASITPIRLILGHFSSYEYSLKKRQEIAKSDAPTIDIAVASNNKHFGESFVRGADLALEEENKIGFSFSKDMSAPIQKKMVLHYFNEDKKDNKKMISDIVSNTNIVATISAQESSEAIDSSVLFEQHGVLFLSTFATDQHLTNHGFNYVFSSIPIALDYAAALVKYCEIAKYKKVTYLYPRGSLGAMNFTVSFGTLLFNKDIHIHSSYSFNEKMEDYRLIINKLAEKKPDAILLLAKGLSAAKMLNQLRSMGIETPVFGYIGLDDLDIWDAAKGKAYNTFVATTFKANTEEDKKTAMYQAFYAKYGSYPNYLAIQGYDALKMLAAAIRKGNSSIPINIAGSLKYNFKGLYKDYYFNRLGRIENQSIKIKEMKNGEFYNVMDFGVE